MWKSLRMVRKCRNGSINKPTAPNVTTVHPRITRSAMEPLEHHDLDRPKSPKKHRADMPMAPPSAEQDTADPTPYRYGERPGRRAGWILRPVRQRVHKCQCCACDWTEDITLDSVTRSCGDPICTFCKDQLRSHEAQNKDTYEPSEEEIPQASDDESSHENTGGSEDDDKDDDDDDDEHSHKAQVGYKNADDSLAAQKEDAGESSEENAPPEGADESSRDADRSLHIAKVLGNMRIEYW
jgi:hypothetical protein